MNTSRRTFNAALASLALGGALAACGSGSSSSKKITLGFIPSWTDGLSTAHVLKTQLEANDMSVTMQELSEPGPLYTGLSQGDIDIYPSAWPEVTHKQYMDKYGDSIEDLGTYYDNAKLTWAVPSYSAITSIDEIKDHASEIGNRIVGIEPGAGLTKASQEDVIPQYGLEDLELVTSSTTAMLAELKKAVEAENEIVVTLWRPFWANATYGMKDLEDPKGALGEGEGLHFLAREGFSEDFPEVASWIGSLSMDDTTYGDLENLVVNEYGEGKEDEGAEAWIKKYPDFAFEG